MIALYIIGGLLLLIALALFLPITARVKFENDFFVSSQHEMTREHYISFVALLTSDTIMLKKQYPEWNLQVRIPVFAHGRLIWYCNKHGLFYQEV